MPFHAHFGSIASWWSRLLLLLLVGLSPAIKAETPSDEDPTIYEPTGAVHPGFVGAADPKEILQRARDGLSALKAKNPLTRADVLGFLDRFMGPAPSQNALHQKVLEKGPAKFYKMRLIQAVLDEPYNRSFARQFSRIAFEAFAPHFFASIEAKHNVGVKHVMRGWREYDAVQPATVFDKEVAQVFVTHGVTDRFKDFPETLWWSFHGMGLQGQFAHPESMEFFMKGLVRHLDLDSQEMKVWLSAPVRSNPFILEGLCRWFYSLVTGGAL